MTTTITAKDLVVAVESRHPLPEWLCEPELTLGRRRLDLVAFNLWGSRAYRIMGFEIKVDRGDWLRELSAFEKSEEWCQVVDGFVVVTPPKLIKADELPQRWGHYELVGNRMMMRRQPEIRRGNTLFPRELATRLIRRQQQEFESAQYRKQSSVYEDAQRHAKAEIERERTALELELSTLRRDHATLLKVMGVGRNEWHAQEKALRIAKLFASALDQGEAGKTEIGKAAHSFADFADRLLRLSEQLREAVA